MIWVSHHTSRRFSEEFHSIQIWFENKISHRNWTEECLFNILQTGFVEWNELQKKKKQFLLFGLFFALLASGKFSMMEVDWQYKCCKMNKICEKRTQLNSLKTCRLMDKIDQIVQNFQFDLKSSHWINKVELDTFNGTNFPNELKSFQLWKLWACKLQCITVCDAVNDARSERLIQKYIHYAQHANVNYDSC